LSVVLAQTIKADWGPEDHSCFNSVRNGSEWSTGRPGRFSTGYRASGIRWTGDEKSATGHVSE